MKEFEAFYVPIPAKREEALRIVNIFKDVYEDPKILKIGQNLKYDLEVLRNYDIELKGKMWDTMIAHYLIQPELHHNMDYMAEIYRMRRLVLQHRDAPNARFGRNGDEWCMSGYRIAERNVKSSY